VDGPSARRVPSNSRRSSDPFVRHRADELNATLQDWLNEFERVQLLLRLSTRLRQIHGD